MDQVQDISNHVGQGSMLIYLPSGRRELIPDSSFDYRRKKNSSIVSFWKTFSLLNFLCCTLQASTTFNFIFLKVRIFSYHSKYRKTFLIFASTDRFISLPLPQFPMPHKRPVQLGGTSFQPHGALCSYSSDSDAWKESSFLSDSQTSDSEFRTQIMQICCAVPSIQNIACFSELLKEVCIHQSRARIRVGNGNDGQIAEMYSYKMSSTSSWFSFISRRSILTCITCITYVAGK